MNDIATSSSAHAVRHGPGRQCAPPQVHGSLRSFESIKRRPKGRTEAADPWHCRDVLTTDYWNPPTSQRQHARQRILALIVAFVLAAILAQAGWLPS
jgi:hypothetical protein